MRLPLGDSVAHAPSRAAMAASPRPFPVRLRRLLAVYYLLPPPLRTSILALALLLSTAGLVLAG